LGAKYFTNYELSLQKVLILFCYYVSLNVECQRNVILLLLTVSWNCAPMDI